MTKLESLLLLKAKTIMDKIESHKNFNKMTKDKTKKWKVEELNWKTLSIQIKK